SPDWSGNSRSRRTASGQRRPDCQPVPPAPASCRFNLAGPGLFPSTSLLLFISQLLPLAQPSSRLTPSAEPRFGRRQGKGESRKGESVRKGERPGRGGDYSPPLPQIRTCAIRASG